MAFPDINPPLLNSSNPWATTLEDLKGLYLSPHTGAVTTRTCTLTGFKHDSQIHQYSFFEPDTLDTKSALPVSTGSLNTLGYSPLPLAETLKNIEIIVAALDGNSQKQKKPFVISVTGSPKEVKECIRAIAGLQRAVPVPLVAEVNLSCPNISGKPPPAFDLEGISEYLQVFKELDELLNPDGSLAPTCGIKTPPYTNPDSFTTLKKALLAVPSKTLGFITATNTLGCSLLLDDSLKPVLNSADGMGIGGMAGAPLHPLALGNVRLIRTILNSEPQLRHIKIIGIGGVYDHGGFSRMRAAGADVVGVGTALGRDGVEVFGSILRAQG